MTYIYHVTTTTGHARKSPKDEVGDDVINTLIPWVKDMLSGQLRGVFGTKYTCRVGKHSSKMCEFIISKTDDNFAHTDLIRFVVCRHSRSKNIAWGLVDGDGDPPNTPFCAVKLIADNFELSDFTKLSLFADFERCISWVWLRYVDDNTNK